MSRAKALLSRGTGNSEFLAKHEDKQTSKVTLLQARRRAGLTQQALADRCGVSRTAIGRMESTSYRMSQMKMAHIAEVLGISTDTLIPPLPSTKPPKEETKLRFLYESGVSWAEIEVAFPGRSRKALQEYTKRQGWPAPPHRRPSRPKGAGPVGDVAWSSAAKRFFSLLVRGDEDARELQDEYPRVLLVERALAEVRATRPPSNQRQEGSPLIPSSALRAVPRAETEHERRVAGQQAPPLWTVGDMVCAASDLTKRGRQVEIHEGVVVYASSRFVTVEFGRYRESFEPWNVWAVGEEPPLRVKDKAKRAEGNFE